MSFGSKSRLCQGFSLGSRISGLTWIFGLEPSTMGVVLQLEGPFGGPVHKSAILFWGPETSLNPKP